MGRVYDFVAEGLDGSPVSLGQFRGRVLLIVNTASYCAYTSQYSDLVALQNRLGDVGLSVLAFPCNQFGAQEPGDATEIATFCRAAYQVSFPVFAKVDINGPATHPLYDHLKASQPGILGTRSIKWNFTKFLVDRDGEVRARFAPRTRPSDLESRIRLLL